MFGQPNGSMLDAVRRRHHIPAWELGICIQVCPRDDLAEHRWRGSQRSLMLSLLKMSPWFQELRGHMQNMVDGVSPIKYRHKCVHVWQGAD